MLWESHHGTTDVVTKLESFLARRGIEAPVVQRLRSSAYMESVIPHSLAVGRTCRRKDSMYITKSKGDDRLPCGTPTDSLAQQLSTLPILTLKI
jgi:hypothetical protein